MLHGLRAGLAGWRMRRGSGWVLVDLEDFKSFCWASSASGVGSIPTRSRHRGIAAALLVALIVLAGAAHAQPAPRDSLAAPRATVTTRVDGDSTVRTVVADSALATPASVKAPKRTLRGAEGDTLAGGIGRDAPGRVMLRSLLVPGWGQLYNHQWIKAGLVIGVQGTLIGAYVTQNHLAHTRTDATARAQAIDARQAALWFYCGAALVSMLDAYVDAHLFTFGKELAPVEVRLQPRRDPAADGVACALTVGF